ncbi:MAG: ATP-binding cassette domain-containing protein [Candidatus Dormiibacterota bacterium]
MSDTTQPPAVHVREISRKFKEVVAVDRVSFDITSGEIFSLLGPNGAGKTTTIRILVTLLTPDSGEADIFGQDVVKQTMAVRRMIGYVPQQLSADASLTGWENVMLFARLYDLPWRERKASVSHALELMGIAESKDRLVSTYSGGMIRRLELAQALINQPRLLVLDEPTIGLDPIARGEVWERVQSLRHEIGTTILMTTHYMEEAEHLCDRVAIMNRGQIRAVGSPSELKQALGSNATLEDVFRHFAGEHFEGEGGSFKDVRATRRTARRVG